MNTMNKKSENYLKSNPVVNEFINKVNSEIETYYNQNLKNLTPQYLTLEVGNKFLKLVKGNSVWGFISRVDGNLKGSLIKKGDLLKPASWNSPAKHARGNIIDGTASYNVYGPNYIK